MKNKLLILLCLGGNGICCAAEIQLLEISKREQSINQARFIKFDEGFFTTIPVTLVNRLVAKETKEHTKNVKEFFSDIISQQLAKLDEMSELTGPKYIFYADIFKLQRDNNLMYIGKFNVLDETMKEAIRQKKGVFLPFNYGIIIYWVHEFNGDIQLFEDKKQSIIDLALEKSTKDINPTYTMYFQRK